MKKQVVLIWDLDGAIGQINSSYPYNYNFENLEQELKNVRYALDKLDEYRIKSCFAITGFSAEEGKYPYVFPELIDEISQKGHEIASHSWRHEWAPLFTKKQIQLSLKRSKSALEKSISNRQEVVGFVPPHNRPMTWLKKGAFSLGDRGIYPFFKMGDTSSLLKQLEEQNYKWVRISCRNLFKKFRLKSTNLTGNVYRHKNITIFENHYTGFDEKVMSHILETNYPTYTVSAHPLMLSFTGKSESKENFEMFLSKLSHNKETIKFSLPSETVFSLRTISS